MKHIIRLVTYGALKPSKWEHGRPSRAREPVDERTIFSDTRYIWFGAPCVGALRCERGGDLVDFSYRLVGMARYPDSVESRYERYL